MKKYLYMIFLLILVGSVNSAVSHFYEIDLEYNKGEISLLLITVQPLVSGVNLEKVHGDYAAEIVSFKGETLNKSFFDIPLNIIFEDTDPKTGEVTGGGVTTLEQTRTFIRLPYYENAKEINIYDKDKKVLTIDVSSYAKDMCGDQICQPGESYQICRSDCSLELKETEEVEVFKKEGFVEKISGNLWPIALIIIILTGIIFFIIRIKKRKNF